MTPTPLPPTRRLLLVDASSYLFRAFHAIRELRSPAGEPTNAIFGVVNMLRKLLQDYPSDYIAAVFDPKGKTFRDAVDPDYKATRQAMPEDLAAQIEPLFDGSIAVAFAKEGRDAANEASDSDERCGKDEDGKH